MLFIVFLFTIIYFTYVKSIILDCTDLFGNRLVICLKSITCATFNPDDLEDPAELNGTDLPGWLMVRDCRTVGYGLPF